MSTHNICFRREIRKISVLFGCKKKAPYLKLCSTFNTLVLLNPDMSCFANSVAPDQLASEEANWSGSALFVIKYMNLYQESGSSNLIG